MTVIDRLVQLRAAANLPAQAQKPGAREDLSAVVLTKSPVFKNVHLDESVARSSYMKLVASIGQAQEYTDKLAVTQMPTKVNTLTNRIIHEENYCLKSIKRTEALVDRLRGHGKDAPDPEDGQQSDQSRCALLLDLRENLALLLTAELTQASAQLFALREQRRVKNIEQTRRLLIYAFPEATTDDITEALQVPELAAVAMTRRVEDGERCPTLDVVIHRLQKTSLGMQRRLEAEAMDLELLFFQFSELVNKNDEPLSEIEKSIESTLQETQIAVKNLQEANALKRGNTNRRFFFRAACTAAVVFIVWYFFGDQIYAMYESTTKSKGEAAAASLLDRGRGTSSTFREHGQEVLPLSSAGAVAGAAGAILTAAASMQDAPGALLAVADKQLSAPITFETHGFQGHAADGKKMLSANATKTRHPALFDGTGSVSRVNLKQGVTHFGRKRVFFSRLDGGGWSVMH